MSVKLMMREFHIILTYLVMNSILLNAALMNSLEEEGGYLLMMLHEIFTMDYCPHA